MRAERQRTGNANGRSSEVTDIRVESFAPGDSEEDCAKHDEAARSIIPKEFETVERIDCGKNFRRAPDLMDPQKSDRDKPQDRDRSEDAAYSSGAA